MYRADEIKTPKHQELRSNVEDAVKALISFEEDMEHEEPKSEMVVKTMIVAEVICVGESVTRLAFTSTGDMATWTAIGFAEEVKNWAAMGNRELDD